MLWLENNLLRWRTEWFEIISLDLILGIQEGQLL